MIIATMAPMTVNNTQNQYSDRPALPENMT